MNPPQNLKLKNSEAGWQNVKRQRYRQIKNRKSIITGTSETDIKTIPKKAYLYVTRIDKNTTPDTLKDYLSKNFPEVICDLLVNTYKSQFSRFKVTIDFKNLEKSQDPSVWPNGAEVSRFFHPRQPPSQEG